MAPPVRFHAATPILHRAAAALASVPLISLLRAQHHVPRAAGPPPRRCLTLHARLFACRSVTMDAWNPDQLRRMQLGGNDKLNKFLAQYGVQKATEIREKYNSKAAGGWRRVLRQRGRVARTAENMLQQRLECDACSKGSGSAGGTACHGSAGDTPRHASVPPAEQPGRRWAGRLTRVAPNPACRRVLPGEAAC